MKKLEKLNSSLFESLESSKMSSLNTVMGGTYDEWTENKEKTSRDTEQHSGSKGCPNDDDTKAGVDVTQTEFKCDHAILHNNNDLEIAVAIDDTLMAN